MEKINIAELLKDCPQGMELDCTMFDNVTFDGISNGRTIVAIRRAVNRKLYLDKYGCPLEHPKEDLKCVIFPKGKTTWEGFVPPCKFKDGDIVFSGFNLISIFKGIKKGYSGSLHSYVSVREDGFVLDIDKDCWTLENIRFATEKEKQKLFNAIKDNGYKWNAETKALENLFEPKFKVGDKVRHKDDKTVITITGIKDDYYFIQYYNSNKNDYQNEKVSFEDQDNYELVPNKFDINTLVPFDSRVLVRHTKDNKWCASFFSHIDEDFHSHCYKFVTTSGKSYPYCIPYEGNEHLLGKTDDCVEYFKTWE